MKIVAKILLKNQFSEFRILNSKLIMWRSVVLSLYLCCIFTIHANADTLDNSSQKVAPLRLGLIPHLSTNLMIKKYQNLIVYLEDQLKRPVIVNTAPDFKTYVKRCAEGRFDLYMTAPHMAAYHEKYNQHVRLTKFSSELRSVVAVRENSTYKNIIELKGATISAPDALALNTLNGEIALEENGLNIKNDVNIKYTPSNNNPLFLLADSKVDAAITGLPIYEIISKGSKLKQPLRILKKSKAVPHMMFMSPQRVAIAERDNYKTILLNINKNQIGKAFITGLPFGELVAITDQDMLRLTSMLTLLEQRLDK